MASVASHAVGLVSDLRDLWFPRSCVGCDGPGRWWCGACHRSRLGEDALVVVWDDPGDPWAGAGCIVSAAGSYRDPLRRLVLAHKENRVLALRNPLSELLAGAVRRHPGYRPDLMLVPVPATRHSMRRRGFDPLRVVAESAALELGLRVWPGLGWRRQPRPQKTLDSQSRRSNVSGGMRSDGPGSAVGPLMIVDDVLTTGATVLEAARVLRQADVLLVGAAVVCYTRSQRVPIRY